MYRGILWLLPGVSFWETLRGEDENRKWLRKELTACVLSRHGAADLAGSLLSAPVTVSAGTSKQELLLSEAGLILRGRAGGARKFPRALAFSPDLDFVNLHTFVRERGPA